MLNFPALNFLICKINEQEFQKNFCSLLSYFYSYPDLYHDFIFFALGLEYVASLYIVLPQQQFPKTVHIFKILISPLHMDQLVP